MKRPFAKVLHEIVRDPRWASGSFHEAMCALTEVASEALRSRRVSFWSMAADQSGIQCEHLYDAITGRHDSGEFLSVDACPSYFEAIAGARVVAVADAPGDPRTAEMAESYLIPLGIGALLDAPVLLDGEMVGVVCHEYVGESRQWTDAEMSFAASIGDLVALAKQSERLHSTQQELRQRESELRNALEAAAVAGWSWDLKTDQVRLSEGGAKLYGRPPDWQPGSIEDYLACVHVDDIESVRAHLRACVAERDNYFFEHRVVWPSEEVHWLQCRGQVMSDGEGGQWLAGVVVDHSRRREMELRLQRSERLEGLGRLAGGVAHDFNNLLTAILGAAQLIRRSDSTAERSSYLDVIEDAGKRAAKLTGQLLAFGRRLPRAPRSVELSELVRGMTPLLEHLLEANIELRIDATTPLHVRADPTQLEQVIMNLAVNARDAMPTGGVLELRTREALRGEQGWCELTVSDSGTGIAPELLSHIFDPFFTTKGEHRGTGLGLAVCHGVIKQFGGEILVDSRLGEGTTFQVLLPSTVEETTTGEERASEAVRDIGTRHLLVVEDDAMVSQFLRDLLEKQGHRVTSIGDGDEAIEWLEKQRPDGLICDIVLSGARGSVVAMKALARWPNLPILLMSGYAPEELPEELAEVPSLTKPFGSSELADWMQQAFAASERESSPS